MRLGHALAATLLPVALAGEPAPPAVSVATARRLPADPEGEDTWASGRVEVCWDLVGEDLTGDVIVLAGADDLPASELDPVAEIRAGQRCWLGPWTPRTTWAITPRQASGALGDRVLARASPLRFQGRDPVEAWLEGDSVVAMAEGGGRLWFATDGAGLSATRPGDATSPPWETWRREDGPGSDAPSAVVVRGGDATWVASDGQIARYDLSTRAWRVYGAQQGLPAGELRPLIVDRNSSLLVGAPGGAIYALDKTQERWSAWVSPPPGAAPADRLLGEGLDGRLWESTGRGVVAIDPAAGRDAVWSAPERPERVVAMVRGEQGGLWFATEDSGVLFRDDRGGWSAFSGDAGPGDDRVRALLVEEGGLLVGTSSGLARLDPRSGLWRRAGDPEAAPDEAVDGAQGLPVSGLMRDETGALWVAVQREGLRRFAADDRPSSFRPAGVLRPGPVNAVAASRGYVWFGSDGGLARLALGSGAWTWWRSFGVGLSGGVGAIAVAEPEQAIWVGVQGGVSRYLAASDRWYSFPIPDPDRRVLSLLPDGPRLWVGTDRGLLCLELASGTWTEPLEGTRAQDEAVQALMLDSARGLWMGTPQGPLKLPRGEALDLRPAGRTLVGTDVTAIEEDGGGAIWLATRAGDAVQYLPANGEIRHHAAQGGASFVAMARDYGTLWFATDEGLASRSEPSREGAIELDLQLTDPRGLAVDGNGDVWVGTRRGALRWTPDVKRIRAYDASLAEPEASSRVLAVASAGAGRVWAGTGAGGVALVDRAGQILERLDAADGLPSSEIRAIFRDASGALWLGTSGDGVVSVRAPEDAATRQVTVLRGASGPGDDRISTLFAGDRGQVCASTDSGVSCFDPSQGWLPLKTPRGLSGAILSTWYGRESRLWVGTTGGVGWRSQAGADRQALLREGEGIRASTGVRSFWEDQAGRLWFGLLGGGLATLDRAGALESAPVEGSAPDLDVRAITEAGGRLWIATDQGVYSRTAPEAPAMSNSPLNQRSYARDAALVGLSAGDAGWRAEAGLGQSVRARDVWALVADDASALWAGTAAGLVRLDLATGARIVVDPGSSVSAEAPLLSGDRVGVPLLGASALLVGGQLVGEPSSPARVIGVAQGCDERDLLLSTGDILRYPGEAGAHELVEAPDAEPAALAVICDEGSLSRSSMLCVGGAGLRCRGMAGQWMEVTMPGPPAASVTALLTGAHGVLWAGYADGTVCRRSVTLAGGADPVCWSDGLPVGAVRAIAETRDGGAWVGTSAGLGRLAPETAPGDEATSAPALKVRTRDASELEAVTRLAGTSITAFAYDASADVLWMAVPQKGVVRLGPPARRSFSRDPIPALMLLDPAPFLSTSPPVTSVALDVATRLWVSQGGALFDHDARPPPVSSLWMALAAALAGGLAFLAGWGSVHYSPTVRRWRRDPASVERIPLEDLAPALRVLRVYSPGFARASVGVARLAALERLSRAWRGDAGALLPAAAEVLGLAAEGQVQHDSLVVGLTLGLALKRKDTLLVVLPAEGDPELALRERLEARAFHEIVPALVLWRGSEVPVLHGAVTLSEADLRSVAWSRDPRHRLASLIWQRSDMQGLSPYQAHGAVQDPRMFFGRDAVLRELTAAGRRRALLVIGPRRVGKTSVLLRAVSELERRGGRAIYVTLRATVAGPYDLAVALARAARLPPPEAPATEDPGAEAACLGAYVRANLSGANLLIDEADAFLRNDRARGSAASEELRALVQEGVCALALAGYGTLYRAALSQGDTVYNLGEPLYLGALDAEAALRLASEPMERMGIRWADPELARQLVQATGAVPHLVQEACRRLLLRVRGFREPVLSMADLYAVLGDWRPEGEPSSLRELLVINVETNLKGPAQAAVWLLADETGVGFTLSELHEALRGAGFEGLSSERVIEVGLALQVAGVCQRGADRFRFLVPLLGTAAAHLDVGYRVGGLREAWRALDEDARARFLFWGGETGTGEP